MYLSHPVRRMREDPSDEPVSLIVELDGDADRLRTVVADADGSVDRDLGFDCLLVTVPQQAIENLCRLDDVARIETAATLDVGVDDDSTKPDV